VIYINKKIFIGIISVAIIGSAVLGISKANAQTTPNNVSNIIQKLSQRFGLNENDVKQVFDQNRQERQSQMETKFEERLNQAITDGKITQAQKELILTKHEQLQAERNANLTNWQNLTPDQRRTEMEKQRTDMKTWATDNGIDTSFVFDGFGKMGGRGMGMMGRGW